MSVIVETDTTLHGLPALVVDNGRLRLTILPTAGGRIWQVQSLRTGRRLLWNNPRIAPAAWPIGTSYDDTFSGGWDVLFPNDQAETLADEPYPDHGELWTSAWDWRVDRPVVDDASDGAVAIELTVQTPISQCRVTRVIRVAPGADWFTVDEQVTSEGRVPLPAMWKQHLALAVETGGRVVLPGGRSELADWGSPRAGAAGDQYTWPTHHDVDMSVVPGDDSDAVEFQFVTDLPETWAAVQTADGDRVTLRWQGEQVDALWLFASYGAWRGNRVVVLEPCTGTGVSVADSAAGGTHRVLQPGETWAMQMRFEVSEGARDAD